MHLVIIGGGQAASSAAAKARELDGDIAITMICEEPVLPYQRPPLSKKYLSGEMPLERLVLRPQDWFDTQNVAVKTGARAEKIDRSSQSVTLSDGSELSYHRLLIATGSHARRLPDEIGGSLEGVFCVRDLADADALAPYVKAGGKAVIIGGGYIGLEGAAVARQAGMDVTVIEMGERILQRVASSETSDFFRILHASHGVDIREGTSLSHILQAGNEVSGVELSDGTRLEADCVIVGIGILPTVDLAEAAGLTINNGIAVDAHCRASDPDIFSAGDCASFPFKGERVRLESVPNAIHQAEIAVANMLGDNLPYEAAPWFWSDQYDVKLQIAGLNRGYTHTVTRPGKREGAQSIWYYDNADQLLAVDAMNDAPAFMMARRIIEGGGNISPEAAADPATNLKEFTP